MIDLPIKSVLSLIQQGRLAKPRGCVVRTCSPPIPTCVLQYSKAGVVRQPLVVALHGAIRRPRQGYVFEGRFLPLFGPIDATIVALMDPSLVAFTDLQVGWFQGHAGHAVMEELTELVAELTQRVRPSRLVFIGGSAGAHPALVLSKRFPDSLCVVVNAQTCISAVHNTRAVKKYRETCWPHLADAAPLSAALVDDVASLYRTGHENTVVYLQNSDDVAHVCSHLLPFVRVLPSFNRLVLQLGHFDGFTGHRFPRAEWRRWVLAGLAAPSVERQAVVAAYLRVCGARAGEAQSPRAAVRLTAADATSTARRDLEIAAALASRAHTTAPRAPVEPQGEGCCRGE
ncbi:MAG: hypothetical protein JW940_06655 [Polyangiaceae bacterium]|nr:hypothetical protein [Polyangiaceae bacterium]